ncbi:c-type cytochrome [Nitrospina watsonii]|uniref:Cytochrome c, class I n=1 Tax=Nitrospina watsonii TaxID=1323948 RepID=A0ABN8VZU3_9BACT|nr:cytochrome c [Nitrospina watsonii]CAI2719309.1 Putative Cytochrome c, class I [Nitrospina watsonii]
MRVAGQNFFLRIGVLLALTLLIAACGDDASKQESSATKPPAMEAPAPTAPEPVPPKPVRAHPVTEETRATYQYYCTQCHGVKGKGDGINAPHVVVPPRDHTKAIYLESRSDEQLFHAIKHGGLSTGRAPCMPAWGGTFDDVTIHQLVSYIRELCDCEGLS